MPDLKQFCKFICAIGILIAAISLFFEWYIFQVVTWEGEETALWEFQLFLGWTSPISLEDWFNAAYHPNFVPLSHMIHFIYLGSLSISLYAIIAVNLEDAKNLRTGKKFRYVHVSSLLLSGYYICIVPIYFFILQEYYFPYLTFTDPEFAIFEYAVGLGYWLECVAFGCMFPYFFYYLITTSHFERAPEPIEAQLNAILRKVHTSIDFSQLIAEERIKLDQLAPSVKEKDIFEQYLMRRGLP